MTAAKQTMAAWSRLIESREDIPAFYKGDFDECFGSAERFPLVIWTPVLDRFPRKTTEKLICDTDAAVYIFEKKGHQIDVQCFPSREIYSSEVGSILLETWLTIRGKTSEAKPAVSTIEINTTSRRYFEPILNKLRPAFKTMDTAQVAAEKNKFDRLSTINFKFMNYGRESLLPGETVLRFLLQPEIRQPLFTIFGKTFDRGLSLAHLVVVTDQELILIQDMGSERDARVNRYGGIWQYIPLWSIDSVSIPEAANKRVRLSIQYHPDQTFQILFDISNLPELEQICLQLQMLIEGAPIKS